jgi:hypothetical protein
LFFSPLHKDQFGISLRKLEELHKEPPTVKVDVNLSGSRRISVPAKQRVQKVTRDF